MDTNIFNNSNVISWLQYFSDNTDVDLEHVKILDITKKNKNLIPAVEAHRSVLVFTEAGHDDIFYRMFDAGLGECIVVYNEGSEPSGDIKRDKVANMIDRGINASAGMLILNDHARTTLKYGIDNSELAYGSVKYVASEIRTVLLSKMHLTEGKNVCVISGESIAVEAAHCDGEGSIIAVEYDSRDRSTMEDNVSRFGLDNITIVDHVGEDTMKDLPVPDVTMLVASASMEKEMEYLLSVNPNMEFVVYTLDFTVAASMENICKRFGIRDPEVIQMTVSKLTSKHTFQTQPSPWIISFKAGE